MVKIACLSIKTSYPLKIPATLYIHFFPHQLIIPHPLHIIYRGVLLASCVLSNTCMGLGVEVLFRLEQDNVGLQVSTAVEPTSSVNTLSVAWTMGFMLLDALLYMVIAWYI